MRYTLLLTAFLTPACATKKVCINQLENNRSIYDVDNSCHLRIRQVVIGSDSEIPKSINFRSGALWTYSWIESKFEGGKFILGHFTMSPQMPDLNSKDAHGNQ